MDERIERLCRTLKIATDHWVEVEIGAWEAKVVVNTQEGWIAVEFPSRSEDWKVGETFPRKQNPAEKYRVTVERIQ